LPVTRVKGCHDLAHTFAQFGEIIFLHEIGFLFSRCGVQLAAIDVDDTAAEVAAKG
jgi:hypothetical protein